MTSKALSGQAALVTGGARGIGAATAIRLAADGAAVAVLDLYAPDTDATVAAIRQAGGTAIGLGGDVADTDDAQAAVAATVAQLGRIDILVNNAGITRDNLLYKMTDADWDEVIGVHLRGPFLLCRAAQRHLVKQRHGKIVNVSSTSALGNRGQANYAAAKAGIQGFTRTLAIELGPYGVNVNAVAPGFIATAMTAATAQRMGADLESAKAQVAQTLPLRRTGEPEDIAGVIAFLAGPDSSYLSGQTLYVDGGPH
ncbi:3-oxoacyl-ACP reductase FabG [Actinospica durhamensis]|uniref:3-oxoacyl-ACP reductase FabG n=1 Tax=Actinospica durhamensis TaxID=1508375 RepID=A0A941ENF4_9ACTN|nr:3-oxoacyl-ACP reductase FabG [Actinospica durhamensis]MBR7834276.1 3-oxoacyl-ACP reductase FabG [Actinospica durhamensis]